MPATELKRALRSIEGLIGKSFTDNLFSELVKAGIDLSNQHESYYLDEIRDVLDFIFGKDASELLIGKIRKDLA